MTDKKIPISPDQQVSFFQTIIEAYFETLKQAFSKSKGKDFGEAEWVLIQQSGRIGKIFNPHVLVDTWEQMELFLRRESKLLCFIEEKPSGLMESEYKFWLFFTYETAENFFKNQVDKPKGFRTGAVTGLPYLKLLEPVTAKLDQVLKDKEINSNNKVGKIVEILEIGEWYLDQQDFTILDVELKKGVKQVLMAEVKSLLQSIGNPRLSSLLLEKRLRNVFKLGWRYFRSRNELESKYFKKLLSENNDDREKGLKLTAKKIVDAIKSNS